jgi:hypothetical protein
MGVTLPRMSHSREVSREKQPESKTRNFWGEDDGQAQVAALRCSEKRDVATAAEPLSRRRIEC